MFWILISNSDIEVSLCVSFLPFSLWGQMVLCPSGVSDCQPVHLLEHYTSFLLPLLVPGPIFPWEMGGLSSERPTSPTAPLGSQRWQELHMQTTGQAKPRCQFLMPLCPDRWLGPMGSTMEEPLISQGRMRRNCDITITLLVFRQ